MVWVVVGRIQCTYYQIHKCFTKYVDKLSSLHIYIPSVYVSICPIMSFVICLLRISRNIQVSIPKTYNNNIRSFSCGWCWSCCWIPLFFQKFLSDLWNKIGRVWKLWSHDNFLLPAGYCTVDFIFDYELKKQHFQLIRHVKDKMFSLFLKYEAVVVKA